MNIKDFGLRDVLMYIFPGFFTIVVINQYFNLKIEDSFFVNDASKIIIIVGISYACGFLIANIFKSNIVRYSIKNHKNYFDPIYYLILPLKKTKVIDGKNLQLIKNLDFDEFIKQNLIEKIKKDFNLSYVIGNEQVFSLCSRFVDNYSTNNGLIQVKREFNLSLFTLTILFPVILFESLYTFNLPLKIIPKTIISLILIYITTYIVLNTYIKHRNAWIKNVYRLYLIIEKK